MPSTTQKVNNLPITNTKINKLLHSFAYKPKYEKQTKITNTKISAHFKRKILLSMPFKNASTDIMNICIKCNVK